MPITVEQEQLEPCRVALNIEVPPEEMQKAVEAVFTQVAKRTNVPGFRPGKAPRHLVKRYIDESRVQEMAFERALSNAYRDALQQAGITPFNQVDPKVDLPEEEIDPEKGFRFKATVALQPHVHMGELEGLTARKIVTPISDEDVEKEIDRYRERSATFEPTEEGAEDEDRVRAVVVVTAEGEEKPDLDTVDATLIQIGANLEEFDNGVRGIKAGEERNFEFTYPEEADAERKGKKATAHVKAEEVLRRVVPEANDEFATKAGFESFEALQGRVREMLEGQAGVMADQEVNDSLIKEVVQRSTAHFPEEMVDAEVSDRMSHLLRALERRNSTLDEYLEAEQKDLSAFQSELREEARETIKNTLVLLELARNNGITLTEKDIEAEIKRRAESENVKVGQMKRLLTDTGELDAIRNRLFLRKITEFLREKAEITEVAA